MLAGREDLHGDNNKDVIVGMIVVMLLKIYTDLGKWNQTVVSHCIV